jgi:hypothetical protein
MSSIPERGSVDWDIFFSYRTARYHEVAHLLDALEKAGLRVWVDRTGIPKFEDIQTRVHDGLARCRLLVAYYTHDYPASRACQWELTAAYLAGEREGNATRRVAVIRSGPSDGVDHLQPVALRSGNFVDLPGPDNSAGLGMIVQALKEKCLALTTPIGDPAPAVAAPWHPRTFSLTPYPRFVGRITDLWRLHSALNWADYTQVTREVGPGVACVTGLAGVGKTMIVEEYAKRFHARYTGGVVWLTAGGLGDGEGAADRLERRRLESFALVAQDLGLAAEGDDAEAIARRVWGKLRQKGGLCLVVVDDFPPGRLAAEFRRWVGPPDLTRTVFTTRGRQYGGLARQVSLDVLEPADAVALLTLRRAPQDPGETGAAAAVCDELGCLALAVDVMGARVEHAIVADPYRDALRRLRNPTVEELDRAARLLESIGETLPTGHEANVIRTLVAAVESVPPEGLEVLRLSAALAPIPIPAWLTTRLVSARGGLDEADAAERVSFGIAQAQRISLADRIDSPDAPGYRVHVLVARTVRLLDAGLYEDARSVSRRVLVTLYGGESRSDVNGIHRCDRVLPHAEWLTDAAIVEGRELLKRIGYHKMLIGRHRSAVLDYERLAASSDRTDGGGTTMNRSISASRPRRPNSSPDSWRRLVRRSGNWPRGRRGCCQRITTSPLALRRTWATPWCDSGAPRRSNCLIK